jgi:purine-binding chemotaxis protein CheW
MSTNSTGNTVDQGTELLTTFYIGSECYGVEVLKVQEVTGTPVIVPVPLAPVFVRGLINLRGQLATALGLRELFGENLSGKKEEMSVVCRLEGNLVSLIVDQIGDVVEIEAKHFEPTPANIPPLLRKFIKGIYKLDGTLLSILDLEKISKELSPSPEAMEMRA